MSVSAYEGIAGTGKTTRLLSELISLIGSRPLAEHERVLALTFMHGARRRLNDRLQSAPEIGGRLDCSTLDSFAMKLCARWQDLLGSMGRVIPSDIDFDHVCASAAMLLGNECVRTWVSSSYAICVVDEAQDLTVDRLDVLKGLRNSGTTLLIGADEFQCLDPALHDNPCVNWLRDEHPPEVLDKIHRTEVHGLLARSSLNDSSGTH